MAIITGSSQGLGKAFAVKLLEAGALVCLSDVNSSTGKIYYMLERVNCLKGKNHNMLANFSSLNQRIIRNIKLIVLMISFCHLWKILKWYKNLYCY